ncbi:MAG: hypothetical protein AVDCRST_MAG68-1429 [uncultured Gemmatimonadetes bacterium]|uniref:Uncharacterized protein n=1 Tax=uncultured Gemmatimonadota bacterium TaxID=203437 RepID=A0A6J4KRE0_9BACT|nr:MAG: hypothetical protein AVDCRST_MAG68-1429 [uncultured Gemmatimonadota bacterium]
MGQLGRALATGDGGKTIIGFFPRHSPLEIVRAPLSGSGPVLRRVLRPDSVRAHLEGTEIMCAFGGAMGGVAEWGYMGGGRFATRGRHVDAIRLLEWTRERGSWVVLRITERYHVFPRVLGTEIGEISRDTTTYADLPEERRYGAATEWYRTHQPVIIAGRRLTRHGPPRRLGRDELDPVGTLGAVPFFAEKGTAHAPDVVYALVGSDEYQPY